MSSPRSVLFITIGNRDVQLKKNLPDSFSLEYQAAETTEKKKEGILSFFNVFKSEKVKDGPVKSNLRNLSGLNLEVEIVEDSLMLKSPRKSGETILKNWEAFSSILLFPIVKPVLDWLRTESQQDFPEKIIWVYTDQNVAVSERFRASDTLFFAQIIDKWCREEYPGLKSEFLPITRDVKNVDVQYQDMGLKITQVLGEKWIDFEKVYVLPQGGIDGINQALTLQLIQLFKDKLIQLTKPHGQSPYVQEFPQLFLRDLSREKVLRHLELYDFKAAADLFLSKEDEEIKQLCTFADLKLNLHYKEIKCSINFKNFTNVYGPDKFDDFEKIKDLVYEIKIQVLRKNYSYAVGRLYTFSENIFRLVIDEHTQTDTMALYFSNERYTSKEEYLPWVNFLEQQFGYNMVEELRKQEIRLSNPNSRAYALLIKKLILDGKYSNVTIDQFERLEKWLKKFGSKRNSFMHELGRIAEESFYNVVKKNQMEEFFLILDSMSGASGYGPYDDIRKKVENHYRIEE